MAAAGLTIAAGPAAVAAIVTVDGTVSGGGGQVSVLKPVGTPVSIVATFNDVTGAVEQVDILVDEFGDPVACVHYLSPLPCNGATMFPIVPTDTVDSNTLTFDAFGLPTGGAATFSSSTDPAVSMYINGDLSAGSNDFGFAFNLGNLDVDASGEWAIVPVPAAVWLFGSALGLLGWIRRRAA